MTTPLSAAVAHTPLDLRARALRGAILRIVARARRGHLGSAFSIVEVVRVLYDQILRIDPKSPRDPGRDRFVLSKGHGCLALYVALADKGFFAPQVLDGFCSFDSILGGHPDADKVPGVEHSTGSLGHGLSFGVGLAMGARLDGRDSRTYVLMGDGECNEGSVWEAAMAASKHRLSNLVAMVDYNKMQSYASTYEILDLEPFADKWRAFGFAVREVDGHDVAALEATLRAIPFEEGKPSAIICHTVKGKGVPMIENDPSWHHKTSISDGLLAQLENALGLGEDAARGGLEALGEWYA